MSLIRTAVVTDDFTGADDTPLQGRVTTTGGATWSTSGNFPLNRTALKLNGTGQIKSNHVGCLAQVPIGSPDHYSSFRVLDTRIENINAAVCCVDFNNRITFGPWSPETLWRLSKRVNGTETGIAFLSGLAVTSGTVVSLERVGDRVFPCVSGVRVGDLAGYVVADAVFVGVSAVGLHGQNSSGNVTLADDFEGGTLSEPSFGTIGCATQPPVNSVLQREKSATSKSVALGGAITGEAVTDVQWRLETEAGGLIAGYDWAVISGATIGANSWSGSVTIPQDTGRTGYVVKIRSRGASAATIATVQTGVFTVGVLLECDGQSNMVAQFGNPGLGISNKCAFYSAGLWSRLNNDAISNAISTLSDLLSLPVGFGSSNPIGATGIATHTPEFSLNGTNYSQGSDWPSTVNLISQMGGDIEMSLWYQGEADILVNAPYYTAALNARINAIRAITGRSSSQELKTGIVILGNSGSGGSDGGWSTMRSLQATLATTIPGAFIAADAITYGSNSIHLSPAGYAQFAYAEGRGMAFALGAGGFDSQGPIVSTASIAGSTVTVNFNLNGSTALAGTGQMTGWEWFNGTVWAAATGVIVVGNTVQFTAAGALQIRYLQGGNPDTTNVLRGNVKAAPAAASDLPAAPTRGTVPVSAAAASRCQITLTTNGSTPAAGETGLRWAWWDAYPPVLSAAPVISGTLATTSATGVFDVALTGTSLGTGGTGTLLVLKGNGVQGSVANIAFCGPVGVT